MNAHEIQPEKQHKKRYGKPFIFGLCHQLAKQLDLEVILIRGAVILLAWFVSYKLFLAYLAAGIIIKISRPDLLDSKKPKGRKRKKVVRRKVVKGNKHNIYTTETEEHFDSSEESKGEVYSMTRARLKEFDRKTQRLDQRLQLLERHITSSQFQLNKAFADLKKNKG